MSDFPQEAAASPAAPVDPARSGDAHSPRAPRDKPAGFRSSPSIELHIDRVVLEGFSRINRAELSLALESELARLLAQGGLAESASGFAAARVDGGAIQLGRGIEARVLARRLARAVYSGLTP
ncbi:MAG TPA: hypothetical protein VMN36_00320 [Verrucomicrobiales bacterium]|nr:hypothetical protein [Verrucomicrobiales bacterium]